MKKTILAALVTLGVFASPANADLTSGTVGSSITKTTCPAPALSGAMPKPTPTP